jgi:tetratricopeptide (TPR) repeat protein
MSLILSPDFNPKGNDEKETVFSSALEAILPLFLLVLNLLIYWQVTRHGFLNFLDDPTFVNNPHVRGGLSFENVAWCFRTVGDGGWSPLAWLSHMLDVTLYRLHPGSHHLTSLFFHTVNSMVLFLFLRRGTRARWPSAFVAVAFAVHPLNVEPLAWVSERRTVLGAFFLFMSLWTYVLYAEKPVASRYFICLLLGVLAIMAGPISVSLPLLLLILDYWPLGRLKFKGGTHLPVPAEESGIARLVLEKIPFFALAAFSTAMTFATLHHSQVLPLDVPLARIPFSYVATLWKILLPHPLSIFYQPSEDIPVWMAAGCGLLILGVSALAILLQRFPYLAAGWFWYLATMTAVLTVGKGAGWPVMADRFAYVPLVGITLIVAWGLIRVAERLECGRTPLILGAGLMSLVMIVASWSQLRHWESSLTLFSRAVTVTPGNAVARNYLGFSLARKGKPLEAVEQLTEALRLNPDYVEAHINLGLVFDEQGRFQEAVRHFSEALRINPKSAEAHAQWAMALTRKGLLREAEKHYSEALRIDPENAEVHNNLGANLYGEGRYQEAIHHYSEALRIRPGYADARRNLNNIQRFMGQTPGEPRAGQNSPP